MSIRRRRRIEIKIPEKIKLTRPPKTNTNKVKKSTDPIKSKSPDSNKS